MRSRNENNENGTSEEKIGFQNSNFVQHDVEQKLSKLAQIHLVLEHLIMINSNLNLDNGMSTRNHSTMKGSRSGFQCRFSVFNIPERSTKAR